MNPLKLVVCLSALLLGTSTIFAQDQNCAISPGAGGTISVMDTIVHQDSLTPDPGLTGATAGLEVSEFVITNPFDLVTDTLTNRTGPRIIGSSSSGMIQPGLYGLGMGDQFCVRHVNYSLGPLQDLIDTLLVAEAFGVSCCDFAELTQGQDVCQIMADEGFLSGSDIEDFNDMAIFVEAYGASPSLDAIFWLLDTLINPVTIIDAPCTGGEVICYATSNEICFDVYGGSYAEVLMGQSLIDAVVLSPNPASANSNLQFNAKTSGELQLELHDLTGKLVLQQSEGMQTGRNSINIDTGELPAGTYLLHIHNQQLRILAKLLVQ